MRDGGTLPEDLKLERDLAAIRLIEHISGRTKVVGKDELRRELGRSPDRGDAVALAAYGRDDDGEDERPGNGRAIEEERDDAYDITPNNPLDPYAGAKQWEDRAANDNDERIGEAA
jgi:hypothetical protein